MSDTYLVLTVIGDDRPGLVGELAATISSHQGNWLESSMSHLAGKFAGIVRVGVPEAQAAALQAALGRLTALKVVAEASTQKSAATGRRLKLALVGHDRIGIVREVSQVLARFARTSRTWRRTPPARPCPPRRCSTPRPNSSPKAASMRGRSRRNWNGSPTT
ncbi:MAG: hypothetical protein M5R42_19455 [Rhodocyclaceae bacterium]|nr:hypothetical protein [Rhodocyclaceae bacterium]